MRMTSDLRDLDILIPIRVSMKRHTEFVQEFGLEPDYFEDFIFRLA